MPKANTQPVQPTTAPVQAPGFWSNVQDLFGMLTVATSTVTTAITAVDDLVVAAQAQTSIIKDTSLNDAEIKRMDLSDRINARKAKLLPPAK